MSKSPSAAEGGIPLAMKFYDENQIVECSIVVALERLQEPCSSVSKISCTQLSEEIVTRTTYWYHGFVHPNYLIRIAGRWS